MYSNFKGGKNDEEKSVSDVVGICHDVLVGSLRKFWGGTRNRQAVMQQRRVELMKMPFRKMKLLVILVQKMLLLSGRGIQISQPYKIC